MMDPANCAKKARAILSVVAARRETTDRSTEEAVQIAQAWIALGQLEYLLLQQTTVDPPTTVSDESGDTEPRQMVMVDEPRNDEDEAKKKTDDLPPERRMRYVLMSRMDGKPRTSEFATLYEAQHQLRFYDPSEVAVMCRMSEDEPWEEVRSCAWPLYEQRDDEPWKEMR